MNRDEILLEVCDVSRDFLIEAGRLYAVRAVSLTLRRGEILGIVGESGCGKSTLAQMIAGSLPVTSGRLRLGGVDYTHLKGRERRAFRRNIQMVFQDPISSFSPRMRIGRYLCEPRRNYDHMPRNEVWPEAEALLERVGLPRDYMDRYPHELSGGQLQRVAIARALAIRPALLLCDEATGALDVSIQRQIVQLIADLVKSQNIGCIFISHDLALVRNFTQRTAIMYLGRVVELLSSEGLEQNCCHPYTQALLDSVLDVYCDPDRALPLLKGEPPGSLQRHEGCAFCTRCPRCTEQCRRQVPALTDLGDGHYIACHHLPPRRRGG